MRWYVDLTTSHASGERRESLWCVTREEARDRARFYRTMSNNTVSAVVRSV